MPEQETPEVSTPPYMSSCLPLSHALTREGHVSVQLEGSTHPVSVVGTHVRVTYVHSKACDPSEPEVTSAEGEGV